MVSLQNVVVGVLRCCESLNPLAKDVSQKSLAELQAAFKSPTFSPIPVMNTLNVDKFSRSVR